MRTDHAQCRDEYRNATPFPIGRCPNAPPFPVGKYPNVAPLPLAPLARRPSLITHCHTTASVYLLTGKGRWSHTLGGVPMHWRLQQVPGIVFGGTLCLRPITAYGAAFLGVEPAQRHVHLTRPDRGPTPAFCRGPTATNVICEQCSAVQCRPVRCSTVRCSAAQCSGAAVQCCAMQAIVGAVECGGSAVCRP